MNKKFESINAISAVNAILAGTCGMKHVLHLYTPHINKHAIQSLFLGMAQGDEEVIYVTEDPESALAEFGGLDTEMSIIRPWELDGLDITGECKIRLIVDAGSIRGGHMHREKRLAEISDSHPVLCTYDVSKLAPEFIEKLVAQHNKLMLTTHDVTVLSSESLKDLEVSDAFIERFVKEYLDMIALALIASKPMCGIEIIDVVHKNFNVLLSPGTIYPVLHELEERGLLEYEHKIKKKVYMPAKGSEAEIHSILNEHLQANEFLNRFLRWPKPVAESVR